MTEKIRVHRPLSDEFKISSPFGKMRTLTINGETKTKPHLGIDFACPSGTPVKAPLDGTVQRAGWQNPDRPKEGFGMRVVLRCPYEDGVVFIYLAHLSAIKVEERQRITAGTVIGLSGNTGSSTGPHLHLEARGADMAERFDMEFIEAVA